MDFWVCRVWDSRWAEWSTGSLSAWVAVTSLIMREVQKTKASENIFLPHGAGTGWEQFAGFQSWCCPYLHTGPKKSLVWFLLLHGVMRWACVRWNKDFTIQNHTFLFATFLTGVSLLLWYLVLQCKEDFSSGEDIILFFFLWCFFLGFFFFFTLLIIFRICNISKLEVLFNQLSLDRLTL